MRLPDSLATLIDYGIIEEVVRPLMSGTDKRKWQGEILSPANGSHSPRVRETSIDAGRPSPRAGAGCA